MGMGLTLLLIALVDCNASVLAFVESEIGLVGEFCSAVAVAVVVAVSIPVSIPIPISILVSAPVSVSVVIVSISIPIIALLFPLLLPIPTPTTLRPNLPTPIPIPVRNRLTPLKLIVAAPPTRALEIIKRIPIHAKRPFRVPAIRNRRRAHAAQRGCKCLQVVELPQEELVPRDQADFEVAGYERGRGRGVGEGGECEEQGEKSWGKEGEHFASDSESSSCKSGIKVCVQRVSRESVEKVWCWARSRGLADATPGGCQAHM